MLHGRCDSCNHEISCTDILLMIGLVFVAENPILGPYSCPACLDNATDVLGLCIPCYQAAVGGRDDYGDEYMDGFAERHPGWRWSSLIDTLDRAATVRNRTRAGGLWYTSTVADWLGIGDMGLEPLEEPPPPPPPPPLPDGKKACHCNCCGTAYGSFFVEYPPRF